jgi:hypothetical protein
MLCAYPVNVHVPDLHVARAGRIEINPVSIREVVWPIVEAGAFRQLFRRAAST